MRLKIKEGDDILFIYFLNIKAYAQKKFTKKFLDL